MISEKKCKGQGRAKDFEGCGELVKAETRTYGLCMSCRNQWSISTEEGQEWLRKKVIPRAKKIVEKKKKQEEKEEKEKLIDYKKKLQDRINEIARLIDIGLPCLARGYHANQIHGGHIFSRGSESSMKFNLHNIHRQGAQSNHFQNEDGLLREGLVKEYGQEYFDYLNSLRMTPALRYTNEDYKGFYKHACKIANLLKKEGRNFNLEQRIHMRNQINLDLEIYEPEFCEFKN